jgi:hypothetical protein
MVATCGYMEYPGRQDRLKHSIRAMDALIATIDANPAMPKHKDLTSYQADQTHGLIHEPVGQWYRKTPEAARRLGQIPGRPCQQGRLRGAVAGD